MAKDFGAFLIAVVYLAMLFVLVRPNSKGPTLVQNVAQGLASIINAGTGGGAFTQSGK